MTRRYDKMVESRTNTPIYDSQTNHALTFKEWVEDIIDHTEHYDHQLAGACRKATSVPLATNGDLLRDQLSAS